MENEDNYVVKNIKWPSIGEFNPNLGMEKIDEFIKTVFLFRTISILRNSLYNIIMRRHGNTTTAGFIASIFCSLLIKNFPVYTIIEYAGAYRLDASQYQDLLQVSISPMKFQRSNLR